MPAPKEFVCNTLRFAQQHGHGLVKTLVLESPRPYSVDSVRFLRSEQIFQNGLNRDGTAFCDRREFS